MAGQTGNPVNHPISPHVISGAFVQQYYHILHEQPDQVHKFYQDSSIVGRPESNGTMVYATTLGEINEKIMSVDFRDCLTEIETADAQLSHKDGVLIVVTGSLTSDEGICRKFTQSFFLAPQESGGYFVLNDVLRFISERKPAEINQIGTQENENSQNVMALSETCSALPDPTIADNSLVSDHITVENNVTERNISTSSVNKTAVENNVTAEPPVQVAKEDPKKAPVIAPPPPIPTQAAVPKKSYASIVKYTKEGVLTPPVAKHKPAPKPISKPVEDQEKSSVKPAQVKETSDGGVAEKNSSRYEQGYSVYVKSLPFNSNIHIVEDEFKKFGAIKPGGVQVRHNKVDRFCFGFVEFEAQQSMQAAIEASPVRMGDREVFVEGKRTTTRVVNGITIPRGENGGGGRFQFGRGVFRGDNFRGRGGYVNNSNYSDGENFGRRNEGENYSENYSHKIDGGENYSRRNDSGENYSRRNERSAGGENYSRRNEGGENYNRRNDVGENFNRRNDGGENYSRRNDGGENFNRRNDGGENFNRRNERNDGGENFNRRNDGGENFNRRNDGENYSRRNDNEDYNRRNDSGENYNRRNDSSENYNRRNDFRNRNEFSGRGRGPPPPPGNGYHQNGNGFHPSRPFQNVNGRFPRVNNGPKQSPVAA